MCNLKKKQKDTLKPLPPGRYDGNLNLVIFKHLPRIDILSISYEISFGWMPENVNDDYSTLLQATR